MEKVADQNQYSEAETARRAEAALLRALNTPHKKQSEMKIGKRKPKSGQRASLEKRGRPTSTAIGARHHPKTEGRRDTWFPWTAEELLQVLERLPDPGQSSTIQIRDEGRIGVYENLPHREATVVSGHPLMSRPSEDGSGAGS
jgi:hypothetical protein